MTVKLMIVGRRAPGLTRAAAHAHLRDVHAPMVVCAPADAGVMPSGYVQNHVIDGRYPEGEGRHAIERDLVTELWFESVDAMRASVATPYYLANLKPDEPRFVDDATVERLIVAETVVRDGVRGPFKRFVFTVDENRDAALETMSGATAVVENWAMPSPFGPAYAAVVLEGWYADEATVAVGLDARFGPVMVAREWTTEALRSATMARNLAS